MEQQGKEIISDYVVEVQMGCKWVYNRISSKQNWEDVADQYQQILKKEEKSGMILADRLNHNLDLE